MRKEHTTHVVIISLMMLIILATFIFVILNKPAGQGAGITTSLPSVQVQENIQPVITNQQVNSSSTNVEIDVLIAFLIILALLFIWYVSIRIAKELRERRNP